MKSTFGFALALGVGLLTAGCGGGGAGGTLPAGPFMLFVQNNNTLLRYSIDTGATTILGSSLINPQHIRISPDGTKFLATINGVLVVGSTVTGSYTNLTGYKFGDWQLNGTRILAANNGNVVHKLTTTGTSLESVFNGNFGAGISSIDCDDNSAQFLITYNVTGFAQLARVNYIGGAPTFITSAGANYYNGRWSDDGAKVVAQTALTGDSNLAVLNADATGLTTVANTTDFEGDATFDVTNMIFYTKGNEVYSATVTGSNQTSYFAPGGTIRLGDLYQP
ncbi:MAG: hypothetical protein JNJ45_01055 [Chthonomonas sp.]|nr:hypothetical protein [Chthonomonas sp.]